MSISGDWGKPETEWRDHHHLSMLIMMTDMTTRPSQAFLSCCGTFSSQNKAPRQSLRAQQKTDIFYCCLLCPYLLFTISFLLLYFPFSPFWWWWVKSITRKNCLACEWAQEKASLHSSLFPKLDPLRISLAAFVPHQVSCKKYLCWIVGPKPSHRGVI